MLWGILIISLSLNKSDHNLPPQSTVTETHICTDDPMGKKKKTKNKKQNTKSHLRFQKLCGSPQQYKVLNLSWGWDYKQSDSFHSP